MKQYSNLLLFVFSLLHWSFAIGQNLEEDLIKVNNQFDEERYSLNVSYEVFKSYDNNNVFYSTNGKMYKNGIEHYQEIGELEIIRNKDYTLSVDHESRVIFILGAAYAEMGDQQEKVLDPVKNALKYCSKHEFIDESNALAGYFLWPEGSEYEKLKFIFNKESFVLKEITLFFKETEGFEDSSTTIQPKMKIKIDDYNRTPDFPEHCFTYNNFLVKNPDQRFECNPKFEEYTLKQSLE